MNKVKLYQILGEIKKSKRQSILEKSAVLFNSKGYSATSMKDIAEEVGVKAASLYNHISSKQEILSVLLLNIAKRFDAGIKDVDSSLHTFNEKLREIIRMHIRIANENQDVTALILQDWKHLEEPAFSEFIEIRKNYQSIFQNVIDQGMKAGELKYANVHITLNVILSSLRWIYNSELYDNAGEVDIRELEQTILELVFKGVAEEH